jgi:hypothetical protein
MEHFRERVVRVLIRALVFPLIAQQTNDFARIRHIAGREQNRKSLKFAVSQPGHASLLAVALSSNLTICDQWGATKSKVGNVAELSVNVRVANLATHSSRSEIQTPSREANTWRGFNPKARDDQVLAAFAAHNTKSPPAT